MNDDAKEGKPAIEKLTKEMFRTYMEYSLEQKASPDDLDMQYTANYYWTRYTIAKDYAAKLDDENVANDPEL